MNKVQMSQQGNNIYEATLSQIITNIMLFSSSRLDKWSQFDLRDELWIHIFFSGAAFTF